jgi:hypothetical protein
MEVKVVDGKPAFDLGMVSLLARIRLLGYIGTSQICAISLTASVRRQWLAAQESGTYCPLQPEAVILFPLRFVVNVQLQPNFLIYVYFDQLQSNSLACYLGYGRTFTLQLLRIVKSLLYIFIYPHLQPLICQRVAAWSCWTDMPPSSP